MTTTLRIGGHEVPTDPWVSPKLAVASSTGRGDGLFASEPIAAGEAVLIWGGPSYMDGAGAEAARARGLGVMQWDTDLFSCDEGELHDAFRINHSCNPNVWLRDVFTLTARSNITPGYELVMDYATLGGADNALAEWDCKCGSVDCRGQITGSDWRSTALQRRYEGHFTPWVARQIPA